MNEILEKVKKTLIAIAPVVSAVSAIWGLDIAAIVTATEAFLVSIIQYVESWLNFKAKKAK